MEIVTGVNKKIKIALLRECSDYDVIYGVVLLNNEVDVEEFQDQINNIKNIFMEHNIDDWTIIDVLEELRKKYDFEYKPLEDKYSLEI